MFDKNRRGKWGYVTNEQHQAHKDDNNSSHNWFFRAGYSDHEEECCTICGKMRRVKRRNYHDRGRI